MLCLNAAKSFHRALSLSAQAIRIEQKLFPPLARFSPCSHLDHLHYCLMEDQPVLAWSIYEHLATTGRAVPESLLVPLLRKVGEHPELRLNLHYRIFHVLQHASGSILRIFLASQALRMAKDSMFASAVLKLVMERGGERSRPGLSVYSAHMAWKRQAGYAASKAWTNQILRMAKTRNHTILSAQALDAISALIKTDIDRGNFKSARNLVRLGLGLEREWRQLPFFNVRMARPSKQWYTTRFELALREAETQTDKAAVSLLLREAHKMLMEMKYRMNLDIDNRYLQLFRVALEKKVDRIAQSLWNKLRQNDPEVLNRPKFYINAIDACIKAKRMKFTVSVIEDINRNIGKRGLLDNPRLLARIMRFYIIKKQPNEAMTLFYDLMDFRDRINYQKKDNEWGWVFLQCLIACTETRQLRKAKRFFYKLLDKFQEPEVIKYAWACLVKCVTHAGKPEVAEELVRRMMEKDFEPDNIIKASIAYGWIEKGNLARGISWIVSEYPSEKEQETEVTKMLEDAGWISNSTHKITCDAVEVGTVLAALNRAGFPNLVFSIFEHSIQHRRLKWNASTMEILLNTCAWHKLHPQGHQIWQFYLQKTSLAVATPRVIHTWIKYLGMNSCWQDITEWIRLYITESHDVATKQWVILEAVKQLTQSDQQQAAQDLLDFAYRQHIIISSAELKAYLNKNLL